MRYHTNHTFGLDKYGTCYGWTGDICSLTFEGPEDFIPSHKLIVSVDIQELKGLLKTILWALDDHTESLNDVLDEIMQDISGDEE